MSEEKNKLSKILKACEKYFQHNDLKTGSKRQREAIPRQVYVYLCRKYTNYSHRAIADFIKLDHSTSVYSVKKIDGLLYSDDEVIDAVQYLQSELEKLNFKSLKQVWRENIAKEKILNELAVLPLQELKKLLPEVA